MNELLTPILELGDRYGFPALVLAALLVLAWMVLRTRNRAEDTRTEVLANANKAQEMINRRVLTLETETARQQAALDRLETELAAAREALSKAQRHIRYLRRKLVALENEKTALAGERDQLRTDLNAAKERIRELETKVSDLQSELTTEKKVRETVQPILDKLERALTMHTGSTDRQDPAKVPETDPALKPPPDEKIEQTQGEAHVPSKP